MTPRFSTDHQPSINWVNWYLGYYSRVPKDNSSYKILGANNMYCGRYANTELTVKLYSAHHLHITKPSIIIIWVIKVINISLLLQCFLFCFRFWKKNNNIRKMLMNQPLSPRGPTIKYWGRYSSKGYREWQTN